MSLIIEPRHALTPMEVLSSAVDGGADVATLAQLLTLQERWEKNEARKAFDSAMSEAKAEMPKVTKGREVDFTNREGKRTNYRYEDLASIAETINPTLSKYGLSYRFRTESPLNAPISVTCILSHRLGHSEENTLSAPRDEGAGKNSIQAIGSAVTYLQRYTLKAALGLAASYDDDGRSAGGASPPESPAPRQQLNSSQAKKADLWTVFLRTLNSKRDLQDLEDWWTDADTQAEIDMQPPKWREQAVEAYEKRKEALA
jgi:hypothetical protein